MVNSPHVLRDQLHLRKSSYWGLLAASVLLFSLPFLRLEFIPLVDYPNHLARTHILSHYAEDPNFQREYYILKEPIPNLAMDVLAVSFQRFTDTYTAGRIVLVVALALFALGWHTLLRATGLQYSWLTLFGGFLFFNRFLFFGFLNYILGLAVFMIATGLWFGWRDRLDGSRMFTLCALALLAYFAHLTSFASLAVVCIVIAAYDYTEQRSMRGLLLKLAPLVLPILLFIAFMKGSGEAGEVLWASAYTKVSWLLGLVLTYDRRFDLIFCLCLAVLAIVVVVLRRRWIVNRPLFLAALSLLVLFFLLPIEFLTSAFVDARCVPPAMFLLLASVRVEMERKWLVWLAIFVVLLFSVRTALIWQAWGKLSDEIASTMSVYDVLPQGARVYVAYYKTDQTPTISPIRHTPHYATVNRGLFMTDLFALESQHLLNYRQRPRTRRPVDDASSKFFQQLSGFDYMVTVLAPPYSKFFLSRHFTLLAEKGEVAVWRLSKPSSATVTTPIPVFETHDQNQEHERNRVSKHHRSRAQQDPVTKP